MDVLDVSSDVFILRAQFWVQNLIGMGIFRMTLESGAPPKKNLLKEVPVACLLWARPAQLQWMGGWIESVE